MLKFKSILTALALIGAGAFALEAAPPAKDVKGQYEYYVPRHISRNQAEQIALERAMIEAVAREFGTALNMTTHQDMRSSRNGESEDFYQSASTLVKGEWIETTEQPKFSIRLDGDDIVVTCEVRGRARAVNRAQAHLDVHVLRNSTSDDAETNAFLDGDKLFLSFTSPVSGYLTVYLEGEDKTVFRMLPFYAEKKSTTPVEANTRYVFFASTEGDAEQYQMTSDGTEHNTLYIIFSPNEYIKPVDRSGKEEESLRQLSTGDFRKWIQKSQSLDDQLQVVVKPIVITKPIVD